jgi:hypothetical protein
MRAHPRGHKKEFYCHSKALDLRNGRDQKQLTDKLIAVHKEVVATAKGYESRYHPADISLAELADWAAVESKCCPFFLIFISI